MTTVPRFRVGQAVTASPSVLGFDKHSDTPVECRVLYPLEDRGYFVSTPGGGFATVDADSVTGVTEMPGVWNRGDVGVVFFGNGNFAIPVLRMLVDKGYDVRAVVTMPDERNGRGGAPKPSPVKEYALAAGLRVMQPTKIGGECLKEKLTRLKPTIGVVVEFRRLPKDVYNIPALGTINLHSSLLPEYRGCSTISSAIRDGQGITGVTTINVAETIDTGDVINNYAVPIEPDDTQSSVLAKLKACGPVMVDDAIQRRMHGLPLVPQTSLCNEFSVPSYAPKTDKRTLAIPWHMDARRVYDFIRAYAMIPGAWTDVVNSGREDVVRIKILKASITDIPSGEMAPGEFTLRRRRLCVACSDRLLSVEYLQLPGRKNMTAAECVNGHHLLTHGFCLPPMATLRSVEDDHTD